tara:strand:- start:286 stop:543 length:258 start_codon:yes stop_codon:yes gene_type:complete
MPRTNNSTNNSTYHYEVVYNDSFEGEKTKLFRTCSEIQELFKISKSSVYNYYMGIVKTKKHESIMEIKKLSPPVERYKRILVEFD